MLYVKQCMYLGDRFQSEIFILEWSFTFKLHPSVQTVHTKLVRSGGDNFVE